MHETFKVLDAQVEVFNCIWNGTNIWCNHLFWFWLSADSWHMTPCQQSAVCDTWQQLAGYWYITPGSSARCTITGVWSRVIGVNSMAHSGQTGCPSQEDHQRSWVPGSLSCWRGNGRGGGGGRMVSRAEMAQPGGWCVRILHPETPSQLLHHQDHTNSKGLKHTLTNWENITFEFNSPLTIVSRPSPVVSLLCAQMLLRPWQSQLPGNKI